MRLPVGALCCWLSAGSFSLRAMTAREPLPGKRGGDNSGICRRRWRDVALRVRRTRPGGATSLATHPRIRTKIGEILLTAAGLRRISPINAVEPPYQRGGRGTPRTGVRSSPRQSRSRRRNIRAVKTASTPAATAGPKCSIAPAPLATIGTSTTARHRNVVAVLSAVASIERRSALGGQIGPTSNVLAPTRPLIASGQSPSHTRLHPERFAVMTPSFVVTTDEFG